jgi:cytochrome c-type biogenesis protein CcmH/NrfF
MRDRITLLTGALVLASVLAGPAGAADTEGWAYELADTLMSPFCPGRTLAECPSSNAESLRMWLIVQEAAGASREEVEAELVRRYGEGILPAPKAEGLGLAAYLVPIGAIVLGGVGLLVALRRITSRGDAASSEAPTAELDPELARIVDEELAR